MAIDIPAQERQSSGYQKADRMQSEGGIFIATDGKKAAVVMLKCETDFRRRSDNFVKVGRCWHRRCMTRVRRIRDCRR